MSVADYTRQVAAAMQARGIPESVIDVFRRRWQSLPRGGTFPCPFCALAGRTGYLEAGSARQGDHYLRCTNGTCRTEIPVAAR